VKQGGMLPVFGDLTGDGRLDLVVKLDNGIREMSRDPGLPVELEAFNADGRSLWRRPLVYHDKCFGNANNVPVMVYDMDGDGKAEVVAQIQEGDRLYVAILDGMSGRVRHKTPWTPMVSDFSRSSTRVHMAVAYLNGKTPAIVTQTGLYENEVYDAFDHELNKLWKWESFGETSGSGAHYVAIADVDGDGRDEVFAGSTLLNPDGTVRWAIYRLHPDIIDVKRFLPGVKDRQVYFAIESPMHAGAYLVDAKTGKIVWKVNREDDPRWVHAHIGWAADIWEGSPGIEMMTNRDGHASEDIVLFAADGKILMNPFPRGWRPVNWTGGKVRDLLGAGGARIGQFDGKGVNVLEGVKPNPFGRGSCNMTADLAGDFRDEVVCVVDGKVLVLANLDPLDTRDITRTAARQYRLWMARNIGAGYASYFEWERE
jgi:rhamnogalacturonan endolyase